MNVICLDFEGVFVPEIWINVSIKTGIEELKLTTRDISDYDVLMKKRLSILKTHGITLKDIQDVISKIEPFEGALDFLKWLQENLLPVIVSDTFEEFAKPLIRKLQNPLLLCHRLTVDEKGMITDYNLRQPDGKRKVVKALKNLNYFVISAGDSYNDINMLKEADKGILFCPPDNVKNEFPALEVSYNYEEIKNIILNCINRS
jgi:phosphoserine / homoserine phosphotransferase